MSDEDLQEAIDNGITATPFSIARLTPRQGEKIVFQLHRDLTSSQAQEIKEQIQAIWGTDIPFLIIDKNMSVYVASDEELRKP